MEEKLFELVRIGDTPAFLSLLDEDPFLLDRVSINSINNPLHIAAFARKTDIIVEIISRKPGFARELNQDGFSPLHIASANGHVEIVTQILKIGHHLCLFKGKDGKIPLHCATVKGRIEVLKELISASPESLREKTTFGETALHLAVKSNQVEAVKFLIEELKRHEITEVVNLKDKDGNTILHLATFRKQHQILGLLIGEEKIISGVEANSINSSGFTAKDILDLIIQNGCDSHDIHILHMLRQSGAVKSKEINSNTNSPNFPPPETEQQRAPLFRSPSSWNIWKKLKLEVAESSTDTQNALMVVAVLIATMTYQAVLSPPSGYWEAEKGRSQTVGVQKRKVLPGEAVMASDPEVYAVFTVFNAIGFFASLAMISLLTSGFPLRAALRLVIISMAGNYVVAVIYMGPTNMKDVDVVVGLTTLLILVEFARFLIWLLKKWGAFDTRCILPSGNQSPV